VEFGLTGVGAGKLGQAALRVGKNRLSNLDAHLGV